MCGGLVGHSQTLQNARHQGVSKIEYGFPIVTVIKARKKLQSNSRMHFERPHLL
jgi:hypothetical protein